MHLHVCQPTIVEATSLSFLHGGKRSGATLIGPAAQPDERRLAVVDVRDDGHIPQR